MLLSIAHYEIWSILGLINMDEEKLLIPPLQHSGSEQSSPTAGAIQIDQLMTYCCNKAILEQNAETS